MNFNVRVDTQLSVFMENKPGRLANICHVLGDQDVNMQSMSVHDTVDHSIVRLVVDNPTKALILLEEEGLYIVTQKVVIVTISNQPGALSAVARRLALADDNIEYAYCTAAKEYDTGMLVIKTKDAEYTAERLLDD